MKFSEVVAQTLAWLQREGRVSYRALRLEFDLTDDVLDALKEELIEVKELAVDKDGKMLVWAGAANKFKVQKGNVESAVPSPSLRTPESQLSPISYTPPHLGRADSGGTNGTGSAGTLKANAKPSPPCLLI